MEALAPAQLVFFALVVMLAFAVRGTTGFGGNAIAVPLLTLMLPIQNVVAVVTVLTILSSLGHWLRDCPGRIALLPQKLLWPLAVALPLMLIGARLGGLIAGRINQLMFNRIVGAVLLGSGVALLFK
ncbi:MAG: sulfite exporter TauE/SafE family protein [Burkholderiales bacterium]|nr:sulfite exporter TauE/SafE family protein [Burkholderiales bacterium]